MKRILFFTIMLVVVSACDRVAWNNPHKADQVDDNVMYSSFAEPPKTLDPAKSYSSDEVRFNAQIYEPVVQYDYFARPYKLVPLTAASMPTVTYVDEQGQTLPDDAPAKKINYTIYDITIKPNIRYQPHPAFAMTDGQYQYHDLTEKDLAKIHSLDDFMQVGTTELMADDYITQIKRLALPALHSPIYGVMARYIKGLDDLHARLSTAHKMGMKQIDLRKFALSGVKKIDDHRFQIIVKGKYPQFMYWLAMPFFAPVPWQVDHFYSQPGMKAKNLTLSWHPVGTGPYMLVENNPNKAMVLAKNPNFHGETFPSNGSSEDKAKGYLANAGLELPFVDKIIYSLEKESIPRWTKFLQGYYDNSAISSDSFDQAIHIDSQGRPDLTPELQEKGIRLTTVVSPTIFYLGFNMLDPVIGGTSDKAKKLRQAITAVVDYKEYISIFLNGRGIAAEGPIPPGIFGFSDQPNPIMGESIDRARKLLAEAGYPQGVDEKSGKPLVLNYDVPASSGPDDKARFSWMRKQFAKLGIQLNVRATQYNRFQEKMRTGNAQIYSWGWHADYPDAENFLFLLYGPNGKVKHGGENASNYQNKQFDALFEQMKNMDNTPEREKIIREMVTIVQQDAPWVWGVYPKDFVLNQKWVMPSKPNAIANNTAKYQRIKPRLRATLQEQWNQPVLWPLGVLIVLLLMLIVPVFISYHRRQQRALKEK